MHDGDTPGVERHLADTRAAIRQSKAHIARLRSDLAATQAFVDAIRRDLIALWEGLTSGENHGSQLGPVAERQRGER